MAGYLLKRLLQAVFVVLAVTLIVALAARSSGDPALSLAAGSSTVTEADLARIREGLGLNRPFHEQYLQTIKGLLTLDFGRSFMGGVPVSSLIARALPATMALAAASLAVSILLAVPLGILAAVKRGTWVDQAIRVVSLVGLSFPNFWLAIMLVLVFSITWRILPPSGMGGLETFIMPALTMGVILTATTLRLVRTTMLETLQQPYVMVARAKGLSEGVVLFKHALRNCAVPLVTYFGLQFGALLGGIVVVERVFNWPGMGSLAFDAVASRDYPVLQATILVLSLSIVLVNLLVDLLYGLIDPRIRTS